MARLRVKLSGLAALAGILALIVSACGGADPTATPRPTATPQATATAAPAATATSAAPRPTAPPGQPTATVAPARPTVAPQATATPRPVPTITPTPAPAPLAPDFPQAKSGGQLRIPVGGDSPSFDPVKELTGQTHDMIQMAYDQLVMHDPNNLDNIIGQVAESWTVTPDGLKWTFKVRPGITFNNGDRLSSQDVKYTLDLILAPASGTTLPSPWKANIASVQSVTAPDDATVVLKLGSPDASILPGLAAGPLVMLNKKLLEAQGRERLGRWPPVGTGPFAGRDGGYQRGIGVELFKRNDYWVKGRPFLNGVRMFIIPDAGTSFAAFLTGQINFGIDLRNEQAKEAAQRLGNKVILQQQPNDTWWSMAMNLRRPPFNDIRVREAVALGIDKQGYISVVNQGLGSIAGFLSPNTGWDLPEDQLAKISGYGKDRKANVARAKQLLTEAGHPNGIKTTFLVRNIPVYVDSNVYMKAQLEEIGITGDLNPLETARYFDAINATEPTWTFGARAHRTPINDPNGSYQSFHLCGQGNNLTGLCDQKLEQMYKAQNLAAADPAKRRQLVWDLENYALRLYHEPVTSYNVSIFGRYAYVKNHKFPTFYKTNRQFRDVWIEE